MKIINQVISETEARIQKEISEINFMLNRDFSQEIKDVGIDIELARSLRETEGVESDEWYRDNIIKLVERRQALVNESMSFHKNIGEIFQQRKRLEAEYDELLTLKRLTNEL